MPKIMRPNALSWRKSSMSAATDCVEVAVAGENVYVRDSKSPDDAVLGFTMTEWAAFVAGVHKGEFDL